MKYILSLFFVPVVLSLPLLGFTPAGTPAHVIAPLSFGTTVYTPEFQNSAFFLKWQPAAFFSLYAGNLSFGGLWTSFSSPAPPSGSALKQREQGKSAFNIQGADKGIFPLHCAAEAAFPGGKISVFAGCEQKQPASGKKRTLPQNKNPAYRLQTGAAVSFPFTVKKTAHDKQKAASGYWALAWKRTYIEAPYGSSWFIENPPFKSFYAQGLIQSFMIENNHIRFSIENGWTENPYGKPAFFVSGSLFHTTGIFLYNTGFFFSSKDYLKHNGSFEKTRLSVSLNPQLQFILPYRYLDTIRFGVFTELFYKTYRNIENNLAFRAEGNSYSFNTDIGLPPLVFHTEPKKAPIAFKDKSPWVFNAELDMRPPSSDFFKHTWTIGGHCSFYAGTGNTAAIKNYGIKSGFKGVLKIKKRLSCTASLAVQTDFPAYSMRIKTGMDASLPLQFGGNKLNIDLGADGEFLLKKTSLQKRNGGGTLKIKYSYAK